jgi:sugar lactone lactonase YvrE
MKTSKPVCLAAVADRCGEGVVWSSDESAVYWVDINRFLIHRLGYPARELRSWVFDEPVTALALTTDTSRLLVAMASRLIWWTPATDAREDHGFSLPGWPAARLNDGRPDPAGNFWVGSMFNDVDKDGGSQPGSAQLGALYRIAPNGTATERLSGMGIANTICWNPDSTFFYCADTLKNEIRAYEYDLASGDIGESKRFFADFERGLPDGSAVDRDGYLWNCRYDGAGIARVSPDGRLDRFIDMPVRNITTCTFGGPDLTTLFITTAAYDTTPRDRLAGSLWMIETDVVGMPENKYRLEKASVIS